MVRGVPDCSLALRRVIAVRTGWSFRLRRRLLHAVRAHTADGNAELAGRSGRGRPYPRTREHVLRQQREARRRLPRVRQDDVVPPRPPAPRLVQLSGVRRRVRRLEARPDAARPRPAAAAVRPVGTGPERRLGAARRPPYGPRQGRAAGSAWRSARRPAPAPRRRGRERDPLTAPPSGSGSTVGAVRSSGRSAGSRTSTRWPRSASVAWRRSRFTPTSASSRASPSRSRGHGLYGSPRSVYPPSCKCGHAQ
jgi:hypothetical protein